MQGFRYQRAKQLIDERGLKRSWVAAKIGIAHGSLNQYLIGGRPPGRETIARLASFLGVSLDELYVEGRRKANTA